jgi:D-glycero-alpha-D-manno-heptose-7-phosphate kinase
VQPISLEHGKQTSLERHLLLFYTGITREASSVLKEQKSNTQKKIETLKSMADTVPVFHDLLLNAEWSKAGTLLHEQWLQKRSLASKISNSLIDNLYQAALKTGAWGGKVAGAGGGGCLLLFVAPSKRKGVLKTLQGLARKNNLKEAKEIPFRFTQTGAEVLVNGDHTPTT